MDKKNRKIQLTYNTQFAPLSYDFVYSLAICRALAEKMDINRKIDVLLINSVFREVGIESDYSEEYRRNKFNDVIMTSAQHCNWIDSLLVSKADRFFNFRDGILNIPAEDVVQKRKEGIPEWVLTPMVPKQLEAVLRSGGNISEYGFTPTNRALEYCKKILKPGKFVAFHPRVSLHSNERNTSLEKWSEIALRLKKDNNLETVLIPDPEDYKSDFIWRDFPGTVLNDSALSFDIKLAASTMAEMNIVWVGGAMTPLHFADVRLLAFGPLNSKNRIQNKEFYDKKGPDFEKQPLFFHPEKQFLDWTPDTALTMEYMLQMINTRLSI